jgi:hypothetical protein
VSRALRVLFAVVSLAFARQADAAPSSDHRRLPPVSVAGAPRSLVTLVVAVPAEFEAAGRVRFEVVISGAVDVMGRLEGEIDAAGPGRPRPVMLTLRVPATALVGLLDVADVIFIADDGRSAAVPIILRVPAVQAIRVSGAREMNALERGDRVELVYRVQNLGNDTEVLALRIRAPRDWAVRTREGATVTLPAYGSQEVTVSVRVPPMPNAGSFGLEVGLSRAGSADTTIVATTRTLLRVKEFERRLPGVVVQPFVGIASSGDGTGVATGMRLAGPLSERLRLQAEFAPRPTADGLGLLGLSSVGAVRMPFNAALIADAWRVDVGNAQATLGELTGINFVGRGVTGTYRGATRDAVVVLAQPNAEFGGEGRFLGAGGWVGTEFGRIGGSISSLEETLLGGTLAGRRLNAVGGDWVSRPLGDAVLSAGLALRDVGTGPSLGYRADVVHARERNRVRLAVLHAPGGSRAFAAAAEQYVLDAHRQVSDRLSVDVDAQLTRDGGQIIASSENRSISVGSRYALSARTSLGARLSEDRTDVSGTVLGIGGFGATQRAVQTSASTEFGAWRLSGDLRLSQLARRSVLLSGGENARTALQRQLTSALSRPLPQLGMVSLGASLTQTGAGVGVPASLLSAQLRWSEVPVALGGEVLRLESEVRVLRSALAPMRVAYRGGLSTLLRSGLELAASAERNPFVLDARGRQGWIFALRVGMSAEVMTSSRLLRPGVVYRDLNGNGRREPGEEGVAGVILRYDNARFTTSRTGEFRVPSSFRGRVRVDPSSIPAGFVPHPRLAADSAERREIALVPTGSVSVDLSLALDPDGRVPIVELANADVWLRDADGFEWVGRNAGAGTFVFEHVPVGDYTVRTGFSRLTEPVRADDVRFVLKPGENGAIAVLVRGRNVRLITPPRQGGRGGVAPRGGRTSNRGAQ